MVDMTLENEYILSFYKDVTYVNEEKNIMLVKHIETGELCVKKILSKHSASVYKQLKEMHIAGTPAVYEVIEDDELVVIEEYIHGRNLAQLHAEKGNFPEEEVNKIALSLSTILINLHDVTPALIHRDIKPSNLMLTPDGVLKLIDFGAAKNADATKSQDTQLLGTFHFAAPEQYGFGSSDERTDIYGFGATINYLLCGKYPNEQIAEGKFNSIIKKCLQIKPDERYKSAVELYESIKHGKMSQSVPDNSKRKYLPVGYRTLTVWKMLLATVYYVALLIFTWMPDEEFDTVDSISLSLIIILTPLWFGNYLNVWKLIGLNSEKKWSNYMLAGMVYIGLVFLILILI